MILIGYWGSQLARLTFANAEQVKPALKRLIRLDTASSDAVRSAPFYRGGLFELILEDARDVVKKLNYLTKTLPAGMGEQLLSEYKQSDQYRHMRTRRTIYLILAAIAFVYATYWIITHWTT